MPIKKKKSKILKGEFKSNKCAKIVHFRSGLELRYIIQLEQDPDVVKFDYESFIIPYKRRPTNKRNSKYIPDFIVWYLDGTIEVVEIKPNSKLKNKNVQVKAQWAKDWCDERGYCYLFETEKTIKISAKQAILIFEQKNILWQKKEQKKITKTKLNPLF